MTVRPEGQAAPSGVYVRYPPGYREVRVRMWVAIGVGLWVQGCGIDGIGKRFDMEGDGDTGDGSAGDSDADDLDPRFDALVAAIEADLAASDAPGVSVAVHEGGAITFAEAYGSGHPEALMAITPQTLFQIGSTTKMLTAIALLQDVEAGTFSMGDTLSEAYPGSEFTLDGDWNDQITLEHLLTHQAGFVDYLEWNGSPLDSDLADWHRDVFFASAWLMSPPGAFWNYSNPNFSIAGLIAESVAGQAYPALMQDRVFAPLGMNRTYMRKSEVDLDGDYALGVGYQVLWNGGVVYTNVLFEDVHDPAHGRPAGAGTWSTPTQMMAVADFLMNGNPAMLADDLRGEMVTARVPLLNTVDDWGYGYGVMVGPGVFIGSDYQEVRIWAHGGNTMSYSSEFWVLPDHDFAISVLSSGYGTNFSGTVATALDSLVNLGDPELTPSFSADPDRLIDHEGSYLDEYNVGRVDITVVNDSLVIDMPDLTELGFTVTPELAVWGDTVAYVQIDGDWYDLTFIGEPGEPTAYIRNRSFVAKSAEADLSSAMHGSPAAIRAMLDHPQLPPHPMMVPMRLE